LTVQMGAEEAGETSVRGLPDARSGNRKIIERRDLGEKRECSLAGNSQSGRGSFDDRRVTVKKFGEGDPREGIKIYEGNFLSQIYLSNPARN